MWAGTSVLPICGPLIKVHLSKYTCTCNVSFAVRVSRKADGLGESKILYSHNKILYQCLSPETSTGMSLHLPYHLNFFCGGLIDGSTKMPVFRLQRINWKGPNTSLPFSSIFCKVFELIWNWEFYLKFIIVYISRWLHTLFWKLLLHYYIQPHKHLWKAHSKHKFLVHLSHLNCFQENGDIMKEAPTSMCLHL